MKKMMTKKASTKKQPAKTVAQKNRDEAQRRKNRECNGWKNWDTWTVAAVIDNDQKLYDYVTRNKSKLVTMQKKDQLDAIKRNAGYNGYFSGISYDNVSITEINKKIKEDF